ncbi:MAG: D-alanyl-D-alanine carboxypeptidase [Tissierellia bacterium]|nr:D-alanyl-D-alanine carboxypeptidase [Tissierellia bacterium]
MKKFIIILLLFLFTTYNISFANEMDLVGEAAILIDMDTGQILYEKNPHKQLYPASTTKIMTAILALEHGNMNDIVTIDDEVVYLTDGSHIALEPGEELLFEDLLNALLIESANDAALAIAKHISGSIEEFVKLMNKKAKEIGALNTNFTNPNGLPDENHVTTAYDLSLMGKYAMEIDEFRNIVKNYTYQIPETNKKNEIRYLKSHNRLLYSNKKILVDGNTVPIKYEGVNGIKTGYTQAAKSCLVTSAERDSQRLIAVVLKSDGYDLYSDIHKLLNYGFNNFEKIIIDNKSRFVDNISILDGEYPLVAGITKEDLILTIPKGTKDKIKRKIIIDESIHAPIKEGQSLGKIEYYLNSNFLGQVNIVSTLSIEKIPDETMRDKLLDKWYVFLILIIVIFWINANIRRRKRRKRKNYLYEIRNS